MKTLLRFAAALGLLPCAATAVLITNNVYVSPLDATYDGQDVVVSNATLTVDGPHALASLRVEPGGVVTHTAVPNGLITLTNRIADEPQLLVGTNDVTLANSNVVTVVVAVKDSSGTITYTNSTDYLVTLAGGQGFVRRTDTSSIPDGALVLITYDVTAGTVASGLTLTVTNALTVTAGGVIDVSGIGNSGAFGIGRGINAGTPAGGSGGGHGGMGGQSSSSAPGGITFGSLDAPVTLGCGGGAGVGGVGGAGGGLARLVCGTTFTVDGLINAKGAVATNSRAGGGSGGSVWITATNFTGAGSILADGGAGEPVHGGGGGGGRIVVEFRTNTFTGLLLARGGAGWQAGGAGTIFVRRLGQLGVVTVDNGGTLGGAGTPVSVTLNPDVIVQGGATVLQSSFQTVGNLIVRSNSAVLTSSTNNATLNFTIVSNLIVEATAKLSVRGCGSLPGTGPGAGQSSSLVGAGAGHGGNGGNGLIGTGTNAFGGISFGSTTSPNATGSGGRTINSYVGGMGGGIVRLMVSRNTQLDGEINAEALPGFADRAGGGSGGSVWITTGGFSGAGKISANGGAGGLPYGGGGAGGRIAVYYTSNNFNGVLVARGATGAMGGGAGTIYLKAAAQSVGDLIFDNGGLIGARSVLSDFISFPRLDILGGTILSLSNSSSISYGNITIGTNSALVTAFSSQSFSVTGNVTIVSSGSISNDGVANFIVGSGGGGHGGTGGRGATSLGTFATSDNPVNPNTVGGGGGYGLTSSTGYGRGGGAIMMTVGGTLQLDGKILANGTDATTTYGGGGAGGSISLTLGGFSGSGLLAADGGSGFFPNGGGGGGGRIGVTCNATTNTFTGTFSAKGGNGYQRGGAGTVYYRSDLRQNIPDMIVDNGGTVGTNTTITTSGINSYNLEIKGGGWVSSASGASLYSLTVRSNGWFAAPGNFFLSGDVTVEAGGGINLNGASSTGSGNGNTSLKGGGGHGGYGGGNAIPTGSFGNVYGSMVSRNPPVPSAAVAAAALRRSAVGAAARCI